MTKPGYTGIQRLLHAARYSIRGLGHAWRHESAFRQELAATVVLVPLAAWLGRDGIERFLLIGAWLLVIVVELLNSAIEAAIDRIGKERHELSGRAKDLGSAAVMMSLLLAAGAWVAVLLDRFGG